MKIAYDSQIFCAQTYGGVSRYICEIASRLAKDPGIEVSIIAPMHVNAYLEHVPLGIVSGFRAPKVKCLKSKYPVLALRGMGVLLGDLMLRASKPAIIHETYYLSYRLGSRRARRVLTIHDMIHEKFASNFPHANKTAQHKALAAKRADHVICISESTRRDAIEILGLSPDKISVIHQGFGLNKVVEESAAEYSFHGNKPFLLFVGNRGGYKNFLRLLEAYGTSKQLRTGFKLICFGGGAFLDDELALMHKLGLDQDQVRQLGGSDQLLAGLYEHATALIYPSLYEGFGIPPLEAMAHNCPVICGETSSIPEVVGDAGAYFDSENIDSIRSTIEGVVGSESRRRVLIEKGQARLKCFSWDRCAAETLQVYKQLV